MLKHGHGNVTFYAVRGLSLEVIMFPMIMVKLGIQTHCKGFFTTKSETLIVPAAELRLLNEHGDIEIGLGRKARSYMAREVVEIKIL